MTSLAALAPPGPATAARGSRRHQSTRTRAFQPSPRQQKSKFQIRASGGESDPSPGSDADAASPADATTTGNNNYGGPNWSADSQSIAPPSPRRVVLGVLATGGLALGGNFLGITGNLLNDHPDVAESSRLDVIYPVNEETLRGGLKRCYNPEKGYEFVYPVEYLADQTMAARNAAGLYNSAQREMANPLDPPPLGGAGPPKIFGQVVQEPQSAFGPMGGTGEENVSVIVSRSPPGGFRLDRFGDAQSQAEWLLANVLARPGSGKEAELYGAFTRGGPANGGGVSYYTFEYTIRTDKWYRHNMMGQLVCRYAGAVFAEFGGRLYTMVAQVPQSGWAARETDFRKIAQSFKVFVPTG